MRMTRGFSLRTGPSALVAVLALLMSSLLTGTAPAATACSSPPQVVPESQLIPGTVGTGWTTIQGTTPVPFDVEILGAIPDGLLLGVDAIVVQITGPQSFLDTTGGVLYGMSGSPVYVNGKLAGAISLAFYGDPTIAGMTPAQPMVDLFSLPTSGAQSARPAQTVALTPQIRQRIADATGTPITQLTGSLQQLPVPLAVSGLSDQRMDELQGMLDDQQANVHVYRAGSATAPSGPVTGAPFAPGAPFGSALAYGDATIYAIGTATASCGNATIAYGHSLFYGAAGAVSLGMSGANIIVVLKGTDFAGFKLGVLTDARGSVVQDRFVGELGIVGQSPPSVPIVTDFTNTDIGTSRHGTTDAVFTEDYWLVDTTWVHVFANLQAVFQQVSEGSSRIAYTVTGLRDDGVTTWEVSNRNMYYSEYDAGEAAYKLINAMYELVFNRWEHVTITGITASGEITERELAAEITDVRTSSSGPAHFYRGGATVKRGGTVTVEVTLSPVDGSPDVVTTMRLHAPNAPGSYDVSLRGGKARFYISTRGISSFDGLLEALNGGNHPNDLIATGLGGKVSVEQDLVVTGRASFTVQVVK